MTFTAVRTIVRECHNDRSIMTCFSRRPIPSCNANQLALSKGETKAGLAKLFCISERQLDRYLKVVDHPAHIQDILDGRVVTMAHAKVLAEFGIQDGQKWRKRIEEGHLGARSLRKMLIKEKGKHAGGRRRRFVHIEGSVLRGYPFWLGKNATTEERKEATQALTQALEWLTKPDAHEN